MSRKALEQNVEALIKDPHSKIWSENSSPIRDINRKLPLADHSYNPGKIENWCTEAQETFVNHDKNFLSHSPEAEILITKPDKFGAEIKAASIADIEQDEVVRRNSWAQDDFYAEATTA